MQNNGSVVQKNESYIPNLGKNTQKKEDDIDYDNLDKILKEDKPKEVFYVPGSKSTTTAQYAQLQKTDN